MAMGNGNNVGGILQRTISVLGSTKTESEVLQSFSDSSTKCTFIIYYVNHNQTIFKHS